MLGALGVLDALRWVGRGVGLLQSLYLAAVMPSTSRLLPVRSAKSGFVQV